MARRGWYEDMVDSMWDKEERDREREAELVREHLDGSGVDEDGRHPDGSRDDEPGPRMG